MNSLRVRLSLVLTVTMIMLGVAGFAASNPVSAAFNNGDTVVVVNGSLNLRQTAGLSGVIVQLLPQGTVLTITGAAQTADALEWYPVITAGAVSGFVAGQYLQSSTGSGEFAVGDAIVVASGPLNLRAEAGTSAAVLTKLAKGTTGTVLAGPTSANNLSWYQIQAGTSTGWVAGDYLDPAGASAGKFSVGDHIFVASGPLNLRNAAGTSGTILTTLAIGVTGTVLAGPTAANGMDWYQIQTPAASGWAAGDFLSLNTGGSPGTFAINSYVYVNVAKLNLRATASDNAQVLTTMSRGVFGKVIDGPTSAGGYDWYRLDVNGTQGWAVGEFLAGGISIGQNATVVDGPVNLRVSASANSQSLGPIPQGAAVAITSGPTTGGSYTWFGATYNGQNGFVAGQFLGVS